MKGLILAAGEGTRLRPLTERIPKCLLPIRGRPLLSIWLDLCATYGVHEVFVNAHSNAAVIEEFAAAYRGPVSIRIFQERQLLGSAGTLLALRQAFEREPYFWIMYGDVLTAINLDKMLEFHLRSGCVATLGLYEVGNPRQCGIVSLDEHDIVCDFTEKPANPQTNLAFAGVMLASPQIFRDIPHKPVCDLGFDVLPRFIGRMAGFRITDYIVDIGTMKAYESAQREWPGLPLHSGVADTRRLVYGC